MKLFPVLIAILFLNISLSTVAMDNSRPTASPVLVELFTSEGCSSCPPADALLRQLDTQPIPGAQLIVLSEHVDYWNHIGWKDPFSSAFFSNRQSMYSDRFGGGTVYTPQMVVDGTSEFVGSDSQQATRVIEKARGNEKLPIMVSDVSFMNSALHAQIETPVLSDSLHARSADVYVVVALNHAESQVLRGENEGHRLMHVAVAQSVTKVGTVSKNKNFAQSINVKVNAGVGPANVRLVVFVQEPGSGKVLGAALQQVEKR